MANEIIGVGEVLWDLLPAGRQLGGAPCNFAFHCRQLGHASAIVSRVGTDALGRELRDAIVLKLMAKDPFDRFQTPQELADAVAPFASVPAAYRPRVHTSQALRPKTVVIPTALPVAKAVVPAVDDATVPPCPATEISAEQEALAAWIEICLAERRRQRRRLLWLTGAVTALAAAAASAVLLWQQLL